MRERIHAAGIEVSERDFFAVPLSDEELKELARLAGGIRELFSSHSPSAKALETRLASISEEELRSEMLSEPRLLRRPILVTDDDRVHIGRKAVDLIEST